MVAIADVCVLFMLLCEYTACWRRQNIRVFVYVNDKFVYWIAFAMFLTLAAIEFKSNYYWDVQQFSFFSIILVFVHLDDFWRDCFSALLIGIASF